MKKIFSLLLVLLMTVGFSSCSKETASVSLNSIYTADAIVTMDNYEYSLRISRLGNGAWDFNFTAPETIAEMGITFLDDNAKITYKGLETIIEKENMNITALCEIIAGILDSAAIGKDTKFYQDGELIEAKGNWKGNEYNVLIDKETKHITGIEYSENDFIALIENYTKMQ